MRIISVRSSREVDLTSLFICIITGESTIKIVAFLELCIPNLMWYRDQEEKTAEGRDFAGTPAFSRILEFPGMMPVINRNSHAFPVGTEHLNLFAREIRKTLCCGAQGHWQTPQGIRDAETRKNREGELRRNFGKCLPKTAISCKI